MDLKSTAFSFKLYSLHFFFKLRATFLPLHYISNKLLLLKKSIISTKEGNGKKEKGQSLSVITSKCAKLQRVSYCDSQVKQGNLGALFLPGSHHFSLEAPGTGL